MAQQKAELYLDADTSKQLNDLLLKTEIDKANLTKLLPECLANIAKNAKLLSSDKKAPAQPVQSWIDLLFYPCVEQHKDLSPSMKKSFPLVGAIKEIFNEKNSKNIPKILQRVIAILEVIKPQNDVALFDKLHLNEMIEFMIKANGTSKLYEHFVPFIPVEKQMGYLVSKTTSHQLFDVIFNATLKPLMDKAGNEDLIIKLIEDGLKESNYNLLSQLLTDEVLSKFNVSVEKRKQWIAQLIKDQGTDYALFVSRLLTLNDKKQTLDIDPSWLHQAIRHEKLYISAVLLDKGANPNWVDDKGFSAAHVAVQKNWPLMLHLLLQSSADLNIGAEVNKSPLDLARELNYKSIELTLHDLMNGKPEEVKPVVDREITELVIRGGGVKGYAYLDAIKEAEQLNLFKLDKIRGVAGASAGAMTAGAIAINFSAKELDHLMRSLDFKKEFFDFNPGIEDAIDQAKKTKEQFEAGGFSMVPAIVTAGLAYLGQNAIGTALSTFQAKKGLAAGEKFLKWFDDRIVDQLPYDVCFDKIDAAGKNIFVELDKGILKYAFITPSKKEAKGEIDLKSVGIDVDSFKLPADLTGENKKKVIDEIKKRAFDYDEWKLDKAAYGIVYDKPDDSGKNIFLQLSKWSLKYTLTTPSKKKVEAELDLKQVLKGLGLKFDESSSIDDLKKLIDTNKQAIIDIIKQHVYAMNAFTKLTFRDLQKYGFKDLRVVATDTNNQRAVWYSADETPDAIVADAIRASMAYPVMFPPHKYYILDANGNRVVHPDYKHVDLGDGGILENYPIRAFDKKSGSKHSTYNEHVLGLYLATPEEKQKFENGILAKVENAYKDGLSYVGGVLSTLISHQEHVHFESIDTPRTVYINTGSVGAMDFDLSEEAKNTLAANGRKAIHDFVSRREGQTALPKLSDNTISVLVRLAGPAIQKSEPGRTLIHLDNVYLTPHQIVTLYANCEPHELRRLRTIVNPNNRRDDEGNTALHIALSAKAYFEEMLRQTSNPSHVLQTRIARLDKAIRHLDIILANPEAKNKASLTPAAFAKDKTKWSEALKRSFLAKDFIFGYEGEYAAQAQLDLSEQQREAQIQQMTNKMELTAKAHQQQIDTLSSEKQRESQAHSQVLRQYEAKTHAAEEKTNQAKREFEEEKRRLLAEKIASEQAIREKSEEDMKRVRYDHQEQLERLQKAHAEELDKKDKKIAEEKQRESQAHTQVVRQYEATIHAAEEKANQAQQAFELEKRRLLAEKSASEQTIRATYEEEMKRVTQDHLQQMEQVKKAHAEELQIINKKIVETSDALKKQVECGIKLLADLVETHNKNLSDKDKQHASTVAELKEQHKAEIESLKQEQSRQFSQLRSPAASRALKGLRDHIRVLTAERRGYQQDDYQYQIKTAKIESINKLIALEDAPTAGLAKKLDEKDRAIICKGFFSRGAKLLAQLDEAEQHEARYAPQS